MSVHAPVLGSCSVLLLEAQTDMNRRTFCYEATIPSDVWISLSVHCMIDGNGEVNFPNIIGSHFLAVAYRSSVVLRRCVYPQFH